MALFLYSELYRVALFRYYPVLGRFSRDALPLETAGPPILWYSWLLGGAVISLVLSSSCPEPGRNGSGRAGSVVYRRPCCSDRRVRAAVVLLIRSW